MIYNLKLSYIDGYDIIWGNLKEYKKLPIPFIMPLAPKSFIYYHPLGLPEINENDKDLSKEIRRFVKIITKAHKDERIDDDEHDLLVEELEDIDTDGRIFDKLNEEEEFYSGEGVPDTPTEKVGKNVDLDSLMRKKSDQFTGSFGRSEFEILSFIV